MQIVETCQQKTINLPLTHAHAHAQTVTYTDRHTHMRQINPVHIQIHTHTHTHTRARLFIKVPLTLKTYNKTCAIGEDSDQPVHPYSLITVFAERMRLLQPPTNPKRDKRDPLP